jgi:hypothetical protein
MGDITAEHLLQLILLSLTILTFLGGFGFTSIRLGRYIQKLDSIIERHDVTLENHEGRLQDGGL